MLQIWRKQGFWNVDSIKMKSRKGTLRGLRLKAPEQQTSIADFLTSSGSFRDGDLIVNRDGLRVGSQQATSFPVVAGSSGTSFTLEDLEAVRVLGKGSGGMVQLVRHKWTGQFFAVKVIQMNIQDEVIRKQIVGELKINQASQCPYVVICYHACYNNGVISIVLEYMDGGSLADVIRGFGTIPEPCLAAICTQVLRGLMYLHHDRHVIHRDIKPSNLLVNHKGEVKITDFGVSAILTNSMGLRNTFVGTYSYMSPERIIGDTYGHDSDIWSLGLTILECAMGKFPYVPPCGREDWLNFYEFVDTMAEQPPPCAPPDQFSPEFCSFISGCIQKEPKDRMSDLELLNHPFIRKYERQSTTVLSNLLQVWSPIV